jgi:hypothetical protein
MRPTTRRTLAASMRHRPPVTRDRRPRQLPTDASHAVPTGEYQSDPPSLLRTIRCSRPRDNPSPEPHPLTSRSISEDKTVARQPSLRRDLSELVVSMWPVK